ncbi:LytTR family DNA-binding domain-containing protein [Sphaerotilus sp.]|uniref:LytR/AlgR family response regulator transcription factor n=1 Tax=Sphaerotilus sp. TaxID=2093942 RepID=UPI002ACE020C|nr:LytTR family DNA-binding domain-containing protein [Sphaerotilus sp.]MDZ7855352.1 LytTR family DNA-binding domain-containing protein [Sphaerotilus sp.]
MTTLRTALIAEDEPLLAAHLRTELQQIWPDLAVTAVASNGVQALNRALELRPDVCFLDIRMPGMTGLEVARALAEEWPDGPGTAPFPLLVFVTAYDQHAVQAFELQAVDYLLKPLSTPRLQSCCQRLQQQLARRDTRHPPASTDLLAVARQLQALLGAQGVPPAPATTPKLEFITAQTGHTVEMVAVEDVVYFEAADKYVRVMTADREYLIRMTLRELITQIDERRFWQIHRSILVQTRFISRAVRDEQGKLTVKLHRRSETLPVSRVYAHLFKGI